MEEEVGPGHLGSGLPGQETLGACRLLRGMGPVDRAWGSESGGAPVPGPPNLRPLAHLPQRVSFCSPRPLPGNPVARRPRAVSARQLSAQPGAHRAGANSPRPGPAVQSGWCCFQGLLGGEQWRAQLCS